MASDTVTKTPERTHARRDMLRRPGRPLAFSALTRMILLFNLAGLIILVVGALVLNEMREGLIEARVASLRGQGELIANLLIEDATQGEPAPYLDPKEAREVISQLYIPEFARVRLYTTDGALIADSWRLSDRVRVRDLPPIGEDGGFDMDPRKLEQAFEAALRTTIQPLRERRLTRDLSQEEEAASAIATGEPTPAERINEDGERVISVSLPVQRVRAVLGVLTLEATDVDAIVSAERRALLPFILFAIVVTILTSLLLTLFIARPLRRLAVAADQVRHAGARRAAIPDLSHRRDDIGDLSSSLKAMTEALYDRIDAIERFAADVSHEIKNPLTSIRSAVETLPNTKDPDSREKLLAVLISDVGRLDRLITDISRASRLDAELARERGEPVDLRIMLSDITELYGAVRKKGEAKIVFEPGGDDSVFVTALEGLLGQVFRNLLDNARTFSPPHGEVRLQLDGHAALNGQPAARVTVEDQGPGVPPENLETVFERFYTERPPGAVFGAHSGLGLSIARQIVESHGGVISAENMESPDGGVRGARFSVILPLHTAL